jgi:hypothetical protein
MTGAENLGGEPAPVFLLAILTRLPRPQNKKWNKRTWLSSNSGPAAYKRNGSKGATNSLHNSNIA